MAAELQGKRTQNNRKEQNGMANKAGVVAVGIAVGLGIGGALMYWFDPSAGKRRRAHMRHEARRVVKQVQNVGSKVQSAGKHLQKTIDRTAGDLAKISRMKVSEVAGAIVPKAKAMIAR
jgi:hypothetical protein